MKVSCGVVLLGCCNMLNQGLETMGLETMVEQIEEGDLVFKGGAGS
jgi:hypothetical protein